MRPEKVTGLSTQDSWIRATLLTLSGAAEAPWFHDVALKEYPTCLNLFKGASECLIFGWGAAALQPYDATSQLVDDGMQASHLCSKL